MRKHRQSRYSLMAKGFLVLISLLVLVFALTYSWFTVANPDVEAVGLSVMVHSKDDFEYAIGFSNSQTGGTYTHTAFTNNENTDLNLEALLPYNEADPTKTVNLLYDYNPTDLTGNGITLIRPAMNYGNWSINTASRNYSIAEENVQYITFDMIFRTRVQNTKINLGPESFAKGACETYSGDGGLVGAPANSDGISVYHYNELTNKNVATSNKYGRFSTDAIVGAVRVAFLEYADHDESGDMIIGTKLTDYESTPALIWVPRPDLYLNNNTTGSISHDKDTTGWVLDTNVASNATYDLEVDGNLRDKSDYSTYAHEYYNVFEVAQNETPEIIVDSSAVASTINASAPANTNKVTLGTTRELISLNHINDDNSDGLPDDGYYYGKVRVRIWIEGTDSEARRALAGGKFSIGFHITG